MMPQDLTTHNILNNSDNDNDDDGDDYELRIPKYVGLTFTRGDGYEFGEVRFLLYKNTPLTSYNFGMLCQPINTVTKLLSDFDLNPPTSSSSVGNRIMMTRQQPLPLVLSYQNTLVHRNLPGFVMQCGDIQYGRVNPIYNDDDKEEEDQQQGMISNNKTTTTKTKTSKKIIKQLELVNAQKPFGSGNGSVYFHKPNDNNNNNLLKNNEKQKQEQEEHQKDLQFTYINNIKQFEDENFINPFHMYCLAMANDGGSDNSDGKSGSNSTQFFIATNDTFFLTNKNIVFGTIIDQQSINIINEINIDIYAQQYYDTSLLDEYEILQAKIIEPKENVIFISNCRIIDYWTEAEILNEYNNNNNNNNNNNER